MRMFTSEHISLIHSAVEMKLETIAKVTDGEEIRIMDFCTIFFQLRQIFSFQYNSKNLDLSQNRSGSLGLFRKGKSCIIANFHRIELVICSHSKGGKTRLSAE